MYLVSQVIGVNEDPTTSDECDLQVRVHSTIVDTLENLGHSITAQIWICKYLQAGANDQTARSVQEICFTTSKTKV